MTEQLSYLAICLGGLEELVAKNLQQKLIVLDSTVTITVLTPSNSDKNSEVINNQRVYRGDSGCGRIKVITTASIEFIDSIRSVQYWFLLVVEDATVDPSKQKGLIDIENVLKAVNWGLIPSYWQDITHPKYRELYKDINKKNRKISFCGRCIRDGKHEFNSLDVAQAIGSAVLSTTDWVVDLTTMDFEIVCFIMNEKLTAGVNIPTESQRFLKAKLPSEVRLPVLSASLSPSLKPSTAYLLATLAKPSIGDVVLDCMCGSGALFTEATFNYKCIGIGGDVDMELNQLLLETLEVNRKMTNNRSLAEAMYWSAHRIPFIDSSVDIALIDLPFGKGQKRVPHHYKPKFPRFVEEIARLLRLDTGRCVLLAQTHQQLMACLDSHYFRNISMRPVNISGYICAVIVAERSSIAFVAPQKNEKKVFVDSNKKRKLSE